MDRVMSDEERDEGTRTRIYVLMPTADASGLCEDRVLMTAKHCLREVGKRD